MRHIHCRSAHTCGIVRLTLLAAAMFCGALVPVLHAQAPPLTRNSAPVDWIRVAVQHEVKIIDDDGSFPVRYTVHKIDRHGDTTRAVIETSGGTVARTLLRNGKPLDADEDAGEHKRLADILSDPQAWAKKQKRNQSARGYATDLVRQMPDAMLYTYVPGQPERPGTHGPEVAIDFKPNPAYKPPMMTAELLLGLNGRLWIDMRSQTLTRIEGTVTQPVNFGWGGVFARIYPGGAVAFEQKEAGHGRWIYSFVDENLSVRELLVHTVQEKSLMSATDIQLLPKPIDVREAITLLLGIPSASFSAQGR